jgi:hypothetical protein
MPDRAALEWTAPSATLRAALGGCPHMSICGCKLGVMKKQASDQSFHDRRYQERKRAEAAKKVVPKKVVRETVREGSPVKQG